MKPSAEVAKRRRTLGLFIGVISLALLLASIVSSLDRPPMILATAVLTAILAGALTFRARTFKKVDQQILAEERKRRDVMRDLAIGASFFGVYLLLPRDWFELVLIPLAGAGIGAAVKWFFLGPLVDSEEK